MRILHTADWHLGKYLHHASMLEEQAYALEEFFRIVEHANPDVLIIAGDIFDRSLPCAGSVKLFNEVITRLARDFRKPVLIISGNHDSPERIDYGAHIFGISGIHVRGAYCPRAEIISLEDRAGKVDFILMPYLEPAVVRQRLDSPDVQCHQTAMHSALARFSPRKNLRRVAVAHAFVSGGIESESERPLTVGGSSQVMADTFAGFCYVALGHLHRPQCVAREAVRYAGSLLKYSFSEADHKKSVSLVEIDAEGKCFVEAIPLAARRDVRIVTGHFDELLRHTPPPAAKEDYVMVELKDDGPILDAVSRLREVFPNLLQIQRIRTQRGSGSMTDSRKIALRSEKELFEAFWKEVQGTDLNREESRLFESCATAQELEIHAKGSDEATAN
jgi:DNA repair protein SbcD/Mre11